MCDQYFVRYLKQKMYAFYSTKDGSITGAEENVDINVLSGIQT